MDPFTHTTLGRTGLQVCRLGLSASYWPGRRAIHRALDAGVNLLFGFGVDFQLTGAYRRLAQEQRRSIVLATGVYNLFRWTPDIRRTLERRLRQFNTDHIDLFMFLGVMKPEDFTDRHREDMNRLKQEGLIRFTGMSCHHRVFAGRMAAENALDVVMVRYNAAHRGAEKDILPHVVRNQTGVIAYTATRWTYLMRRPPGWPTSRPILTARQAYRFVLSNPAVHVCLTAPRNDRQMEEDLRALEEGPLSAEEMRFAKEFGDAVYGRRAYFMDARGEA